MATSKGSQTRIFRALFLKLLAPTFPPHISLVRQVEMKLLCDFRFIFSSSQTPRKHWGSSCPTLLWSSRTWRSISHLKCRYSMRVLIKTFNLYFHLSGFGWQKRAKEVQGVELPIHHQASLRQSNFHQAIYHRFTRQDQEVAGTLFLSEWSRSSAQCQWD